MSDNREDINLNSYYSGNSKKKYKKRKHSKFLKWWKGLKKWKKIALSVTACVLALFIVVGSVGAIYINVILGKIGSDDDFSNLNSSDLGIENVIDENIFNIALFGVDSRKKGTFTGLSDSIMILSVNKNENTVKLVSIMRDSLVPIENNKGKISYNKINSAYSIGGPALAVKTLNSVFGLDISAYATVNFFGMADIIDAVGGIEIDVTKAEINDKMYGLNVYIAEQYNAIGKDPSPYYINTAGTQKVNGMQAVAYARLRRPVNAYGNKDDFGRTERQRVVLKKIMDKALAMDVTTYPSLVKKLTPYVKTSLSNSQMLSLAGQLAKKPTLIETRVPHDDYIINADYRGTGASAVYYNYKYAGKVLRAFLYDNILPEDYMTANGVDKTGWHNGGSSGSNKNNSSNSSSGNESDNSSSEESNSSENESSNESNNSSNESQGNESNNSSGTESGNQSTGSNPNVSQNPDNENQSSESSEKENTSSTPSTENPE
ncbi:MAG: LCP family protein [Acutalibacteraceae bacterium]|nr:LCP family protein [Acutalibacteraceae bacterium]